MLFYSQASQDEFVYNMSSRSNNGTFLDIGSGPPDVHSNTFYLEQQGWTGVCIDVSDYDYSSRTCKFYKKDALKVDYAELLLESKFSGVIDYLSLDIDKFTYDCLTKIPLQLYTFKIITIEHDSYIFQDKLRAPQRKLLLEHGYYPICTDVTCLPLRPSQYFEDWWVHPSYIDVDKFSHIKSDKENCQSIIRKFNKK